MLQQRLQYSGTMKIREIIGVPVIAMKEGTRQGSVVDAVIDAAGKVVSHYLIGRDSKYDLLIVDAPEVAGVGNDFVVVPDASGIRRVFGDPKRMETVSRGFYLDGASALSSDGRLLGKVVDFEVNEASGEIESVILEGDQDFKADSILAMSGATVFIGTDSGRKALVQAQERDSAVPPETRGPKHGGKSRNAVPVQAQRAYQSSGPAEALRDVAAQSTSGSASVPGGKVNFRRMLIGKKMARDVVSDDGVFKANEGDTITEWMIQLAEQHNALQLLMKHVEPA